MLATDARIFMTTLWQDLRFGARTLTKSPGLTVVIVIALALGLGVNIAVFGIVNSFLIRPPHVAHPEQLSWVFMGPRGERHVWGSLSYPDVERLRQQKELFSDVLATASDWWVFGEGQGRRARSGEPVDLSLGELASGNAFQVMGVQAALGRTFTPEDDRPGAPPVIVLSDTTWRHQFGADPSVLGRKVYLNTAALTVIGVMPPDFAGFNHQELSTRISYWAPLAHWMWLSGVEAGWMTSHDTRALHALARLQPGVTLPQAQAQLDVIAQTLATEFPASNKGTRLAIVSEVEGRYGESYRSMQLSCALALLVAGLVLVICCANIANLLLARALKRNRELGIRLALGAGRARIVRQLLTESLLLAVVGGGLGLALAFWFGDLVLAVLPETPYDPAIAFEPDLRTIGWAVAATLLAGLGFGAFPAWRASRGNLMTTIKTDARTEGHRLRRPSLRQVLVIAQLAISIVVVASGGLFLRSLDKLEAVDPGYRTENLVSGLVNPGLFTEDEVAVKRFFEELTRRLEQLPGVRSVSSSLYMPLVNVQGSAGPLIKDGDPPPPPNETVPIFYSVIAAKYFETMGTTLLTGRDFVEAERKGRPGVVIINAQLARTLYGREDAALGKQFRLGGLDAPPLRIVGVARDGRYVSLVEEPRPWLYLPSLAPEIHDTRWSMRTFQLRAASERDVPAVAAGLRAAVASLDPRVPVSELMAARGHLSFQLLLPRVAASLGSMLAMLALALATMGIYSVMTYAVSQRTREIGIRMALGGQVRDVLRMVLGQGLGLIGAGVVVGCLGAWAITRLLASLLYGVSPADPLTYLTTVTVLMAVALLATLIPARRATKVDPVIALRHE
jgi:predicted permease